MLNRHKPECYYFTGVLLLILGLSACQKNTAKEVQISSAQVNIAAASLVVQPPAAPSDDDDVAAPATAYNSPFGLAMGISEADLTGQLGFTRSGKAAHLFQGQPPRPAQEFSDYYAVTAPISGVCKVGASRTITAVSGNGEQLRAAADHIASTLQQQYGQPNIKKDKARADIYTRRPQFWMVGLKEGSVSYGYLWARGKTERELPDNILNIIVFARAHAINYGEVGVSYEFANYADCEKEWRMKKGRKQ